MFPDIETIKDRILMEHTFDPRSLDIRYRLVYHRDGIKATTEFSVPYFTTIPPARCDFTEIEILKKDRENLAKIVREKYECIYAYEKKQEEMNMPYNFNVDVGLPFDFFSNPVPALYKAKSVKESIKGLIVTAAKQPKDSVLPYDIKDYKIYNNKVLVVWFMDGSFTKAVVSDGDEFSLYIGLMVCLFKKYLGEDGSKKFNKMMEVAMKKLGDIDKNKEKQNEEKAIAEKKRHKAEMKRKAKALKKKEEAIDIQKQGFIRAMQEIGEDDRK